ncbi:MAG TPA: Sjogren's syndrome/scleroderma autoantigen 1 family protein [Nitrososphaera sp.]|nr:Sjogren's syndrome/scleroderma autoantigen 1 family protein [Nitrososphaera sp.]
MSSEDATRRIKSAASLLLKGGTLTSEECLKCGGVQVRFADKITCINCGNETITSPPPTGEKTGAEKKSPESPVVLTSTVSSIIKEKIESLALEIKSENDLAIQKQKAELLESYLRILEKAKSLMG